jgi:PAS domain S-box-containing protein
MMKRWVSWKQSPFKLTLLALVLGFAVDVVWNLIVSDPYTEGVAAFSEGVLAGVLTIVVAIAALYYILSHYSLVLRESEEKYRELVEKATCIILKTDSAGRIVSFNEYARVFFGYDRGELLGKSLFATIAPRMESTGRDLTKLMADVVAHPEQYRTSINENVKKSGERVWIQWNNSAVEDERGRPTGVICIGTDVTESVRAEEALKESEERFRSMFESSGVGIGIATPDGSLLEANPALLSLMGFTKEEARGVNFIERIHPDDLERVREARKKMVADGSMSYLYEARIRHKGGKYLLTEVTGSAVEGEPGRPLYTIAVVKDIAAEKEAKEALRESEEKFRKAFVVGADAFYVSTLEEGRFVEVNDRFVEVFGYSKEEAVGRTSLQLGLYANPPDRGRLLSELKTKGSARNLELNLRRKDGEVLLGLLSASLMQAEGGNLMVGSVTDITELKKAEEQLRQYSIHLEEMVKERTKELEDSQKRLVETEKLATAALIATEVAQDLRNPLTAIKTGIYYLEEALPRSQRAKVGSTIGSMKGSLSHASKIANDLLEFSRPTEFQKVRLAIEDVVQGAVASVEIPSDVQLKLNLGSTTWVEGDRDKLTRTIRGLILNATEAEPFGGKVEISSSEEADKVIIRVSDTGVGISEEGMKKLFDPFFTTKAKGIGLGLAICKRIVEAHGGRIEIRSIEGKGTDVFVTLPAAGHQ